MGRGLGLEDSGSLLPLISTPASPGLCSPASPWLCSGLGLGSLLSFSLRWPDALAWPSLLLLLWLGLLGLLEPLLVPLQVFLVGQTHRLAVLPLRLLQLPSSAPPSPPAGQWYILSHSLLLLRPGLGLLCPQPPRSAGALAFFWAIFSSAAFSLALILALNWDLNEPSSISALLLSLNLLLELLLVLQLGLKALLPALSLLSVWPFQLLLELLDLALPCS